MDLADSLRDLWQRSHGGFSVVQGEQDALADVLEKYADAGYQGLDKLLEHAFTPIKKPRNGTLTKAERAYNRALAKLRVRIEHVNRRCKIFRVAKEVYRGHRRHFQKTWMVVAALVNYRYAE